MWHEIICQCANWHIIIQIEYFLPGIQSDFSFQQTDFSFQIVFIIPEIKFSSQYFDVTLRKLLPDFKDKRVLDLGCGYGWHCIYAMEHGASSVVGCL